MIETLNRMVLEAYARARAEIEAEGRRIEGVSARLDLDGSTLTRDDVRVVFSFDTTPILDARDAAQVSMTRRAR